MPHPAPDAHAPWQRGQWQRSHWGPWNEAWFDGRRRSSPVARLVIPVVVSLLVQAPIAAFWAWRLGTPGAAATLALAIAGPLLLFGARRFPGPIVALVTAAATADFLLTQAEPGPPYIALAFAIVGAIVRGARLWAWIAVGLSWVLALAAGIAFGLQWHPARIALTTLLILVVFGIGEAMRSRREHFAEYRRLAGQRRQSEAQAERSRIARELHDVLAHSLSQINVQAGVGLHLMDAQPEKAKEALASIKDSSKSALDEVRSLLGVLRADGEQDAPLVPEPDFARLPSLIASVSTQGIDAALDSTVDEAPKAVQLAVYRIVQESLTNVVRHSGATRATVDIRRDDAELIIEIADDGTGIDPAAEGGRGLLGMQERAELLGGTITTGRSAFGGALVTARIPIEGARA